MHSVYLSCTAFTGIRYSSCLFSSPEDPQASLVFDYDNVLAVREAFDYDNVLAVREAVSLQETQRESVRPARACLRVSD